MSKYMLPLSTNTQQEIDFARNWMAKGNYPLGMSDCEVVGIQGNCGSNCPVLLRNECECQNEMCEAYCGKRALKQKE